MFRNVSQRFDGAYNLVLLNALGDMLVARDPLGIGRCATPRKDRCSPPPARAWPLLNLGFEPESIKSLLPGQAITITEGEFAIETLRPQPRRRRTASSSGSTSPTSPARSTTAASISRARGWARSWRSLETVPLDDDTIVVPVPDTSKAAADAMAYKLGVPSLRRADPQPLRRPHVHRGRRSRRQKAETKYTPLREVLEGKRVLLVEDSIVRSTTMKVLLNRIRTLGGPREIHVRVACPPIVAPCFYGIDMSTVDELFAPHFLRGGALTDEAAGRDGQARWAPIRSAICRSNRSPAPSASTATSSARPASPATIPRRAARSSTRSRFATMAIPNELTKARWWSKWRRRVGAEHT